MRKLLFPLSIIYGCIIRLRNFLFNKNLIKSTGFTLPVILVGNLSAGGTGKTPCVEYLAKLLKDAYNVAVLSRGYRRKTRGFLVAGKESTWRDIGDEPLQIASKFPEVTVAVDRNRREGINHLLSMQVPPECIILDDGFQHRKITPGLSILLTEYNNLYVNDFLLPSGRLREHGFNSTRADIIIVTKSPKVHSPISEKILIKQLNPKRNQLVFFSYIHFNPLVSIDPARIKEEAPNNVNTIVLFSGIANPAPLEQHLNTLCTNLIPIAFSDHHHFSEKDITRVINTFDQVFSQNKIIVTTEKDLSRMKYEKSFDTLRNFPVFYAPISMAIHPHSKGFNFDQVIKQYVRKNNKDHFMDPTASAS